MKNLFHKLASAIDRRIEKSADVVYPQGRRLADDLLEQQKIEDLYDFFIQQKIDELNRQQTEHAAPSVPTPTKRPFGLRAKDWLQWSDAANFAKVLPKVWLDPGFVARQVMEDPSIPHDVGENMRRIGTRSMLGLGKFGVNLAHLSDMALNPKTLPRLVSDDNFRKKYKHDWNTWNNEIQAYWKGLEGKYKDESLGHGINQAIVNTGAHSIAAIPGAIAGRIINAAVEPAIAANASPWLQKLGPLARKVPKLARLIKNYGTAGREFTGLRPGYMAMAPAYMNMLEDQVYGLPGDNYAPYTEPPTTENPNPQHRHGLPIRGTINLIPGMGVPARIAGLANDWIKDKPFNTFDYQKNPTITDHGGAADQGFLNSVMMSINPNPFVDLGDSYLEGQKNRDMGVQDAAMTQVSDLARLLPGKWGKVLGAAGGIAEQAYPTLRDMGVPSPWTYARTLPQRREMKRNEAEEKRIWDEYNRIAKDNNFEGRFKRDLAQFSGETQNKPLRNPEFTEAPPASFSSKPYRTAVSYSPIPAAPALVPWTNTGRNSVPTEAVLTNR